MNKNIQSHTYVNGQEKEWNVLVWDNNIGHALHVARWNFESPHVTWEKLLDLGYVVVYYLHLIVLFVIFLVWAIHIHWAVEPLNHDRIPKPIPYHGGRPFTRVTQATVSICWVTRLNKHTISKNWPKRTVFLNNHFI